MSTTEHTTSTPLPAAWYRDPSGRHERRWWDGAEWSDKVADGDQLGTDPPVRSRPVEPEVPATPSFEPEVPASGAVEPEVPASAAVEPFVPLDLGHEPETEATTDEAPSEPVGGFDSLGKARVPIAERPTTAPATSSLPGRRTLVLSVVGAVVVLASLAWGMANYRTADQWRDRGEALQEDLATQASNADAFEEALAGAASNGARLADGQEAFAELRDAAVATADELRRCADDLNAVLGFLASSPGGDPTSRIDSANQSCTAASLDGEALIQLLDQIA